MIFRKAAELKKDYTVFASFYKIKGNDKQIYRNVCDIKSNEILGLNHKLDAYFIMLNPGSCHPQDKSYCIQEYKDWNQIEINLVKSCPDSAQYQVMRLMDNKRWKFVRILNLSDIKNGDIEKFEDIFSNMVSKQHSLFDESRDYERAELMSQDAIIIASWTKQKIIKDLAILCKEKLKDKEISGIPFDKAKIYYKYIKPHIYNQQIKIIEELNSVIA